MSFDLYFCRKDKKPLPFGDVAAWAKAKPWFRVETASQLVYENADTGVYFTIDAEEELDPDGKGLPEGITDLGLTFNLNFLRPRYFAWEAMPVMQSLQHELSVLAIDPQGDMIPRVIEATELVKSWEIANERSVTAIRQSRGSEVPVISPRESERLWKYNSSRAALQQKADGMNAFVPRIMPFEQISTGRVVSVFVWTEGIPTAVPATDWIAYVKSESGGLFRKKDTKIHFSKAANLLVKVQPLLATFDGDVWLLPERNVKQAQKNLEGMRFEAQPKEFENLQYSAFVDI